MHFSHLQLVHLGEMAVEVWLQREFSMEEGYPHKICKSAIGTILQVGHDLVQDDLYGKES